MQKCEKAMDHSLPQVSTPSLYIVLDSGEFSDNNTTLSAIMINLKD